MKTFLVPTDFSENALHAARYALTMNRKMKAKIVLFHSYVVPVYASDIPVIVPIDAELLKAGEESCRRLHAAMRAEFPESEIIMDIKQGYPEEEIIEAASSHKADLIIMGTKGASGLRETLIGTITASVMENATCPVMAVPFETVFKPFERFVFATNYAEGDFRYVEQVLEFVKAFDATLVLLHISSGEIEKSYEYEAIERFKERIKDDSAYSRLEIKLIESTDVYEVLNKFIVDSKADVVAMTMRKRSFIQKLFSRSVTKRMAYHTHIPLIAFRAAD
ncbi:MAG: universal stress protein [Bacteroidetes bacterium]|nr:MAG: universal stress protein [Bacteroidota bacterium]REK05236.1 MAG: universal stress protein [Bacteroidota bacterium]REK32641.1 MAG: universal stress protein [Bacteroidota bacterium]REK48912.1 MAG: universal stress protein [Bacteroidota bacterium]